MVFILFSPAVNAQTQGKAIDLEEMVVTGQYGENSLAKSVYKVKVIDPKRIQAQGAFNLQQLLANELNVRINVDPILGGSLQLQGVSGNNIKILIDGVAVVGRENGNIDLSQINLNNVERIELVEGPMSVNFGTDALGGVINIITKKQKQESTNARTNLYYESIGQYNADVSVGLGAKKYGLLANVGRNFFEGYSENPESREKLWKPRTQYMADLNLSKYFEDGTLRWSNQFFHEKVTDKGEPTVDWTQALAQDKYYNSTRFTTSVFLDKKHQGKRNMSFVASYNFYQRKFNTYQKNLVDQTQELIPSSSVQDTNYFHQIMSRGTYANTAFSAKVSYQMGYELNHEFAYGKRIENEKQNMGDYSFFASSEIKIFPRFLIRPGFRISYHTRFSVPPIPSINIKYDITDCWTLRGSFARGFRAPTLKELYLQFTDISHNLKGNSTLNPENSYNFQLNLLYQNKTDQRVWRFEPSVFYSHINNMIDLAKVGSGNNAAFQYVNINHFSTLGLNLNTEYRKLKYQITLGYAHTGRKNNLSDLVETDRFFYTYEWRLNFVYNFIKLDGSVNLFYKYNGKIQTYQNNYMQNEIQLSYIDPFSLMDLTLTKNLLKKKVGLTLGFKNIMNIKNVNASFNSGPHSSGNNFAMTGMGRTFFIGIRYVL